MSKVYSSMEELIGGTPLLELKKIEKELGLKAKVLAKLEYFNPAGSVKDRIAREMILDAIAEKLKNLGEKTRRWDVLTDVLNANDYQNIRDERERTVKVLFKDYKTLSASMRQQLLELGFEITEEGKHYRLTYYGDGRYKTTIAKTGSDWREGKNIASVILKSMM